MILSQEQTNKILEKLKDYELLVIDVEGSTITKGIAEVSEEYFNEKVNEALEEDVPMDPAEKFFEEWYESLPNQVLYPGHRSALYVYDRMKDAFIEGYKHGKNME